MTRALGCMRITDPAVIEAAIDAGVTLLDTADAYLGNEEIVALAAAGRDVRIVTKGGLTRPDGAWVPDGRAKHLAAAARASKQKLGAIDMYLLHAVDPKVSLATSVRALVKLQADGIVRAIGLSNVSPTQLEEAERIARIAAVEVELSPWKLDAIRGGLVRACEARGIELYAHRPFGGPANRKIASDIVLRGIAEKMNATPHEVVLAWLRALSPAIVPLPGASTVATARSAARILELGEADDAALRARFLELGPAMISVPRGDGEVVVVTGIPGAGKTTLAQDYVGRGYARLNRDERGGSLLDLSRALAEALAGGADRVVLDNTYPTRASRAPVIELAHKHGLAARCVVVATPLEQAQANAIARMLAQHGRLLEPAELAKPPNLGPGAQFRWRREAEAPRLDEGFDSIDEVPFVARPAASGEPALLVELDHVVWVGRPERPEAVQWKPGARDALTAWSRTHAIAATSWLPGITHERFTELVARLELPMLALHCAHPAGPPVCWCRKPLPGLALALAHVHGLSLELAIGAAPADKGAAARAGVPYHDLAAGWPSPRRA